jgi:hypothetical protein
VAVLAYNRLQERKVKRAAERAFGAGHADVLMAPAERAPAPAAGTAPDPAVDYVMELSAPSGIAVPLLREFWAPIDLRFARRAFLEPREGGARAALQLVSRAGVVGDAELIEFRSAVETLAAKLGASVAAPEMRAALEAARELDRACADADIQVALHVVGVPAGAEPGQGAFQVEPGKDGVTLTLDVARTPEPGRAYEAMARAGLQLAAAHGGRLVDDNGAALDERALQAVGAQLEAIRQSLSSRGIEPGGPLALRLFS